jgi:argininosuccinate lyase
MAEKPWDGRFSEKTDQSVEAFTASIAYDRRLYPYDIAGSIAHCKMLAAVGVITDDEASRLVEGLGTIKRELDRGEFIFDDSLEDIHMHIEARLLQVAGKVAQKLHTARSRNDQVALDVRMYLREETRRTIDLLQRVRTVLVDLASGHPDVVMPGYTHTQRAQPVLFAHHMLAYYEMFTRDQARFSDCLERIDVMPLGAAALAGTTYPIDQAQVAQQLAFSRVSANSMDAVSDRDFAMEFLATASICMVHLSRLSEEFVLWSTSEFGFITLADAFATGSSIMPQKKNPDIPEIVRGKTGRVFGSLMALLTLMKSLPMAYNRDMQEDKEPLFDAVDTLKACLHINVQMIPRITVNREAMRKAASVGFLNATDMADYLVGKGMPFRKAHACVGSAVAYALDKGCELDQLTLDELTSFSPLIDADIFDHLTLAHMIDRRQSPGGRPRKT